MSSHTGLHLMIVVKNARPGVLNILQLVQFSLYFWSANDYGDFRGATILLWIIFHDVYVVKNVDKS